jgi:hypothetical protein
VKFAFWFLLLFWQEQVQENNTLQSIRRNSKEFESADRTVSERAVYPRLGVKEKCRVVLH